jgi:hypothetical protein
MTEQRPQDAGVESLHSGQVIRNSSKAPLRVRPMPKALEYGVFPREVAQLDSVRVPFSKRAREQTLLLLELP